MQWLIGNGGICNGYNISVNYYSTCSFLRISTFLFFYRRNIYWMKEVDEKKFLVDRKKHGYVPI